MLSESKKQEIARKLNSKGINKCPMCGGSHFDVIDGYVRVEVQENLNDVLMGGPFVPSCAIACNNCGFISHHALAALGL